MVKILLEKAHLNKKDKGNSSCHDDLSDLMVMIMVRVRHAS